MLKKGSTATSPSDIAVDVRSVVKVFTQSQRENAGNGVLKRLARPEKKRVYALDNVTFQIRRGEFVAYAGPNGAGKSTTMKLLCGMLLPTDGKVSVLGLSPEKNRISLMKRLGVLFGNRTELWWDHPVMQSFAWKKAVWQIPENVYRRNLEMAIELLDLKDLLKTFARELSLGQRMRADIAMMLLHAPEVILLDEPTLGLDVVAKRQMIAFLKTVNRENGVTIIVTSHDMDDLEEMAERILMISAGKIAYDGDFDGLRALTGRPSRLRLTVDSVCPPDLPTGHLLSEEKGVCEYELDLSSIQVHELLAQLSTLHGIRDLEIQKAPIEQVIAELFRAWR